MTCGRGVRAKAFFGFFSTLVGDNHPLESNSPLESNRPLDSNRPLVATPPEEEEEEEEYCHH